MTLVRLIAVATIGLCALALLGCPKPPPDPNRPDAADAGPFSPPPTCAEACGHVEDPPPHGLGCPTFGACLGRCQRILRPEFRRCIGAAPSCAAVDTCDR